MPSVKHRGVGSVTVTMPEVRDDKDEVVQEQLTEVFHDVELFIEDRRDNRTLARGIKESDGAYEIRIIGEDGDAKQTSQEVDTIHSTRESGDTEPTN